MYCAVSAVSAHPIISRIAFDFGETECLEHGRHVHPEAPSKTFLHPVPAADRIIGRASPRPTHRELRAMRADFRYIANDSEAADVFEKSARETRESCGEAFAMASVPSTALVPLALTHLNLDVRDLARSERFYRDVLELSVERRATSLRVCDANALLVLNEGPPQVGGTFHFGFRVPTREDVNAWISRLRAARIPILIEPAVAGAVYVGRIADPDGYEIEIYAELA